MIKASKDARDEVRGVEEKSVKEIKEMKDNDYVKGEGGIVRGPQPQINDDSGPEAVIPLDRLNRFIAGYQDVSKFDLKDFNDYKR